jgi:hypothetical protein
MLMEAKATATPVVEPVMAPTPEEEKGVFEG